MAVSDPTLKELKGHILQLINSNAVITDDSLELLSLCDCLERIFSSGFHPQNYILGLAKRYDCWLLFQHLASIPASVTLVPCSELGISVVFVENKAIIMTVQDTSVALESESFSPGDILDEINGIVIHNTQQGVLRGIVRKAQGQPVTAVIIKSHLSDSLYPPLVPLIKSAGLDPVFVLHGESPSSGEPGPNITYLGYEVTGRGTDVKQIQTSIIRMLNSPLELGNTAVCLECQELGVRVRRDSDNSILYSHQYMQITSCGRTVHNPRYFGYIVENKESAQFECHVFYCPMLDKTDSILQSIGQGFKRTHFAV
uniref:PID domain-containing protein n=1 Tax=Cacopsylla melanoneura TaxID=428564 RepID=A0A8D8Y1Q2_9HEMI